METSTAILMESSVIDQVAVQDELVVEPALVLPGDDVAGLLIFQAAVDGDVLVRADVDLHAVADGHVLGLPFRSRRS
jgi:uncharacterized protein YaiI (UPF0178 family)